MILFVACSSQNLDKGNWVPSLESSLKAIEQTMTLATKRSFSTTTGKRSPASLAKRPKVAMSNKKVYFRTLYGQYNALRNFPLLPVPQEVPSLQHCPSFHTHLLEYKGGDKQNKKPKRPFNRTYPLVKNQISLYPELALPLSLSGTPRMVDILKDSSKTKEMGGVSAVLGKALKIHLQKIYAELQQLCEYGQSENYYAYENLMSYLKNQGPKFTPSKKNMDILLKTTLFFNWALLKGLSLKTPPKLQVYEKFFAHQLNLLWAKTYFEVLAKLQGK